MPNNKERIDDLEAGLGLVQDELQKLSTGINDKFRGLELTLNRTVEESLSRMMEMVTTGREGGSSISRGNRQTEEHQPSGHRESHTNPLAPAPVMNNFRHVKLEFPKFNGGDPTEWMSKAKQYFAYHEMPREQRVSFASYHLSEEANEWWQAVSKARGLDPYQTPWEIFAEELWIRFGPLEGENFDEALSHIRQKGPLIEYQREFERLQNKVEGWTEKALVGAFMGGLNTSISNGIRIFKPKTLTEVINLARHRDDQLQKEKRWNNTRPYNTGSSRSVHTNSPTNNNKQQMEPRKLSWDEMTRKRSLGLCFSCDENFFPGHKCKQPQLFIMEGEQDNDDSDGDPQDDTEPQPEISLHALTGWDTPSTIRLHVDIGSHQLLALVDSGSTHNFISEKAAQRLRLSATATTPFMVRVANGYPLKCGSRYETVELKIGRATFTMTLHVLPLVGLDLVLGVK